MKILAPNSWDVIVTDHAIERYRERYCSPLTTPISDGDIVGLLKRRILLGFPKFRSLTVKTRTWILTPDSQRTPKLRKHVTAPFGREAFAVQGQLIVGDICFVYAREGRRIIVITIKWPNLTPLDQIKEGQANADTRFTSAVAER